MKDEFERYLESLGYTNFARLLKPGADRYDRLIFSQWMDNTISTEMAISRFKYNNKIPDDYKIPAYEFEYWLGTLGYRRKAYCDRDED